MTIFNNYLIMTATVRVMRATETPTADARAMTFSRPVDQTNLFASIKFCIFIQINLIEVHEFKLCAYHCDTRHLTETIFDALFFH